MNIPAGIDPADIMQSDVMDCLPEYKCPFCGAYMFYLRDDDAGCQECGQVFGVELVIKNESTWSFQFWQNGAIITRPTQRAADLPYVDPEPFCFCQHGERPELCDFCNPANR